MAERNKVRTALRVATAASHQRVDDLFSKFELTTRSGLADFLSAQAAAHLPVEAALDAGDVSRVVPDWAARRRWTLLVADLAALGRAPPPVAEVAFDGVPALLGAAYVLEGSRLGGALLRQSVAPGLPCTFLAPVHSAAWQRMLLILDEFLSTDEEVAVAAEAACRVFTLFEASGRQLLKVG